MWTAWWMSSLPSDPDAFSALVGWFTVVCVIVMVASLAWRER